MIKGGASASPFFCVDSMWILVYSDKMKIWLLQQDTNTSEGNYYDSCVVVAATENEAREMYPHKKPHYYWTDNGWKYTFNGIEYSDNGSEWVKPEEVVVEYIGESYKTKPEVLVSSFNSLSEICYIK